MKQITLIIYVATFISINAQSTVRLTNQRHRDVCVHSVDVGWSNKTEQPIKLRVGESTLLANCVKCTCAKKDFGSTDSVLELRMVQTVATPWYDPMECWITNCGRQMYPHCESPQIQCHRWYKGNYGSDI